MKQIFVTRSSMPPYEEYIEAIKPLWESHWITNMGMFHEELEKKLAQFLKVPEVSLMVNGHMSLELAIQSFDFPKGSEVITTPFTFISTTHAIVRNGLKPVFCDVKACDGTIDESKIEALITEKTVAILPVHVFGHMCNVHEIESIAYKYGLKVIYDAAHAFGVEHEGHGAGEFGDASIFSFHATKVFNTIEGGCVVCKNHDMYEKLYNLKNFGIRGEELVVSVGANSKMNEFSAIMGLCNLKHFDEAINGRKKAYDIYRSELQNVEGIEIFDEAQGTTLNYSYFPIMIENKKGGRNAVYDMLKEKNISTRKYFYPLTSDQACFKNKYVLANLNVARNISNKILSLPIYDGLAEEDAVRICNYIRQFQESD